LLKRSSISRFTYTESLVRYPQQDGWGFRSFETWHRVNEESVPDVSRQRDGLILIGQNVITKVGNRLSNDAVSYLRRLETLCNLISSNSLWGDDVYACCCPSETQNYI
jgi:hypothetical protein